MVSSGGITIEALHLVPVHPWDQRSPLCTSHLGFTSGQSTAIATHDEPDATAKHGQSYRAGQDGEAVSSIGWVGLRGGDRSLGL